MVTAVVRGLCAARKQVFQALWAQFPCFPKAEGQQWQSLLRVLTGLDCVLPTDAYAPTNPRHTNQDLPVLGGGALEEEIEANWG